MTTGTEAPAASRVPVPAAGELVAFGKLLERAEAALTAALRRTGAAEAELSALADSTGAAVRSAAAGERERIRRLAVGTGAVYGDGMRPFAELIEETAGA